MMMESDMIWHVDSNSKRIKRQGEKKRENWFVT